MHRTWLDDDGRLLSARCPLPLATPFTAAQALTLGVSKRQFGALTRAGLVRPVVRGVFAAAQAPNDMSFRASALALVLPPHAVVADRTAAWLHGVDILPRSALVQVPPLDVVHIDDTRLRRPEVAGSRRGLARFDVTTVSGVRVTTGLRTALDLGRLLWRFDALAAIDGFLRIGVPHDLMVAEMRRFRGYRGVRQLRALVPVGDGRSESPGESALRLHWLDAGLPRPELQRWEYDDDGVAIYRLDITDPVVRFAAEYDGGEFHSSETQREHDDERRTWLDEHRDWHIEVFTKVGIYDRSALHDPRARLLAGYAAARRASRSWTPRRPG